MPEETQRRRTPGTPANVDPNAVGYDQQRSDADALDRGKPSPTGRRMKTSPERDEAPDDAADTNKAPEQDIVGQAAKDIASGQADTDRYKSARRTFNRKFAGDKLSDIKADQAKGSK